MNSRRAAQYAQDKRRKVEESSEISDDSSSEDDIGVPLYKPSSKNNRFGRML